MPVKKYDTGERGGLSRREYLLTAAAAGLGVATAAGRSAASHDVGVPYSEKRGFAGYEAARGNALNVGWSYNWLSSPDNLDAWNHDSFVPMINGDDLGWTSGASDRILNADYGPDAVLGFNEPDHEEGYNDVNTILYPHWETISNKFRDTDITIVSPSIKTGTAGGRDYLDQFMSAVESDDTLVVDEIAIHWYAGTEAMRDDPGTQAQWFLDQVESVYQTYGQRPIWITEFGGANFANVDASSLASSNVTFLERVIPELEARDYVKRYSWWSGGPATWLVEEVDGHMQLTDVGRAYVGFAVNENDDVANPVGDLPSSATVDDGAYNLVNVNSGQVLEVANAGTADGDNVQQGATDGTTNQQWNLRHDGAGRYVVTNVNSGLAVDVADASADNGANVQQWSANEGGHQRWYVDPIGNGQYRIVAAHSGLVLDVSEGSTADGANVLQWEWTGGDNQRWTLESVDGGGSGGQGIAVGENQATDVDGDGAYMDLNGNGRLDNDDVVTYFEQMDSAGIQNNVAAFDYNGNGRIDFDDVVTLFEGL